MLIKKLNFLCCLKRQILQTSQGTQKLHGENVMDFTYQKCFSFIKRSFTQISDDGNVSNVSNVESVEETEKFQELRNQVFGKCEFDHQLLVIQPVIKWGAKKKRDTTPELQLAESVSLVHTLNNWKIVDKKIISLTSFLKKTLFGKGNLDMLTSTISKNKSITAVFISIDMLTGLQHRELEVTFNVPVFDRYTIVVQIFKQHAQTKEAKLQVSMAEIPYMRSKLRSIHEGSDNHGAAAAAIGGSGETFLETRRRILSTRERKIKQALDRLRNQRKMLRTSHKRNEFPVVAVVGYTNSGKTSLIKALTGDKSLEPKDNLFATLDVTVHAGTLPSMLRVLYVDTVGFISNIPTQLVESFTATLEDAMVADVIVHVRDVSHPDTKAQEIKVTETLASFNLGNDVLDNIIIVGNKIDMVSNNTFENQDVNFIPVSATKLTGIIQLQRKIDASILKLTDRLSLAIRVPTGSNEARWLYKEATVSAVESDPENSQCSILKVVITRANLEKFRHHFIINHST